MVQFTVLPRLGPTSGRADTLIVLAVKDRERIESALGKLKAYLQQRGETSAGTPSSVLPNPGEAPPEGLNSLLPTPGQAPRPSIQVQWEERTFDGHPVTRVLIANPWQPVEPSFCFYRDESVTPPRDLLLVALRFQSLKNMLTYVAGSPQAAGPTGEPPTRRVPDVRANPDFTRLRPFLPATVSDLGYSDLRREFLSNYWLAVAWASLMQGASGRALFKPDLVPPAEDIAQHLFGLVNVTTSDETGIRCQAYGPVAYSTLLAGGAAALGFALPATIRQHQLAARKECQAHLERLGVELSLYATTHDGRFPQNLRELVDVSAGGPGAAAPPPLPPWLLCPGQPLRADVGYEYVPGATKDSPPQTVVAYDRKGNHPGGRNVLFADGTVAWLREDAFQQASRKPGAGPPVGALPASPALTEAREEARKAVCASNLEQIGMSLAMYVNDHKDRFPPTLKDLMPDYLLDEGLLHCPADTSKEPSYLYVPGLTLADLGDDPRLMVVIERAGIHAGGRNVLFGNWHAGWMDEHAFQARWAQQREKFTLPSLKELGDTVPEKQPAPAGGQGEKTEKEGSSP
jgi:prepilin-type processing-associated H-X9-DG protein